MLSGAARPAATDARSRHEDAHRTSLTCISRASSIFLSSASSSSCQSLSIWALARRSSLARAFFSFCSRSRTFLFSCESRVSVTSRSR